MTVKELIAKLTEMPSDAPVIGHTCDYEQRDEIVDLQTIRCSTYAKVEKPFRDMMDHTDYTGKVYAEHKSGESCVFLRFYL